MTTTQNSVRHPTDRTWRPVVVLPVATPTQTPVPAPTAVRAARPDVVHVNGLQFATLAWHLRRRLPETCAVVLQDHASRYPVEPGGAAQRLKRAALRRAMQAPDGYLFTAAAQAVPWQAAGLIRPSQVMRPVPEGSTTLSPAAVDEARAATGISGSPAILWVGRLNANKDPLCVVDACAAVQATYPALTLTMVFGDDDLLSEVRRRVGGHVALAPKVRLMGRVPHDRMALVYSAADIFVLGSHYEGSGFALIEACACGVPPAVTDIPSFRALTGAGRIGALWRVGDPYACADAICRVASAAAPGQRDAVRAHFERSLSWSAIGRLALASYGQLLIERRATASCIATP